MSPVRLLGHLLLWLGFFAGAYVTVQRTEVAEHKWSTISWPFYIGALMVGIGGVVLLRATQKQAATHADKLHADIKILEFSIEDLLTRLGDLLKSRQQCDVFAVHKYIDARLMEPIANFVEARQTIIHTYGLNQYAELMTDFSLAERSINRAWSASADGYVDEVWLSLERADGRLQAVANHLAQYKKDQAMAGPSDI